MERIWGDAEAVGTAAQHNRIPRVSSSSRSRELQRGISSSSWVPSRARRERVTSRPPRGVLRRALGAVSAFYSTGRDRARSLDQPKTCSSILSLASHHAISTSCSERVKSSCVLTRVGVHPALVLWYLNQVWALASPRNMKCAVAPSVITDSIPGTMQPVELRVGRRQAVPTIVLGLMVMPMSSQQQPSQGSGCSLKRSTTIQMRCGLRRLLLSVRSAMPSAARNTPTGRRTSTARALTLGTTVLTTWWRAVVRAALRRQ